MGKNATTPAATGGKFTISFGMVNIPVAFRPLLEPGKPVSGHKLCPEHKQQIKQVYRCPEGDHIVEKTIIGYTAPSDPKRFVVLDEAVLAELTEERTGTLELLRVVPVEEIDPLYYSNTYLIWPQDGGEEAYDLLTAVLRDQNLAGFGAVVLRAKTVGIVILYSKMTKTLVAHVCEFASRIRISDVELVRQAAAERPAPKKTNLAMAKQFIASLPSGFDPEEVEDSYSEMLLGAIKAADSKKPIKTTRKKAVPAASGDLMDALKASLDAVKTAKTAKTAKAKVAA